MAIHYNICKGVSNTLFNRRHELQENAVCKEITRQRKGCWCLFLLCMEDTPVKMARKEKEYNNPTNALRSVFVL